MTLTPDVRGFTYDGFERAPELIASGECAARAALPTLLRWLDPEPIPSASDGAAKLGSLAGKPHAA